MQATLSIAATDAAARRTGGCTPKLCPSTKGTPPVSITMWLTSLSLSRPPRRSIDTTLPVKGGCLPARSEGKTRIRWVGSYRISYEGLPWLNCGTVTQAPRCCGLPLAACLKPLRSQFGFTLARLVAYLPSQHRRCSMGIPAPLPFLGARDQPCMARASWFLQHCEQPAAFLSLLNCGLEPLAARRETPTWC